MAKYTVTHKTMGTAEIEAERFVQDGSGTRFYNGDGGIVAAFSDGEIASVTDAAVKFAKAKS